MWNIFAFCCGDSGQSEAKTKNIESLPVTKKTSSSSTRQKLNVQSPLKRQSTGPSSRILKKDRYEGEELDGVPHGNGSMLYANGDFYRGEWVIGKKEGRGLQIYQNQGVQYEGEWQNDHLHGNGKLIYANGSYFIGQFKNGKKDGKGLLFDSLQKKMYDQAYDYGKVITHKEVQLQRSKEESLPTIGLDKQRFNTQDLSQFENKNPKIKKYKLFFFLKYFSLCQLTKLEFIAKAMREWTIKEVIDFLDTINLKEYKEIFYKNKVKGKDMITLTQKELKDDLHMRIGDRKRFLNFVTFLSQSEMNNHKDLQGKNDHSQQAKNRLKFGLAMSQKKIVDNLKSIPIYEESIKEELESASSSERNTAKNKINTPTENNQIQQRYGSVTECCLPRNLNDELYFLEKKIQPESERNSTKPLPNHRKDSKDISEPINNSNNFQPSPRKDTSDKFDLDKNRQSEELNHEDIQNQKQNQKKSSSSSSNNSVKEMNRTRKKSEFKLHHNTEIRQLYEFLKDHRTLQFLIKEKDIKKLQLIGEGGSGEVYKGKYIGQPIAIKDYLKSAKQRHQQDFMKQVMIISDLKHPNIVLYMGICITANKFILITEYLENGSLYDQLHKKKKKFTELEKIEIAYQIVKGMVYLHNMKKILHRDLKSSNVLIGEDWNVVKLCDFGLSGQKKKQKNHRRVGTYQWMAPQVIRNDAKIDEFSDVYSFGVIIWELLSEKIPYEGLSLNQIIGLVGYDPDHQFEDPPDGCQFLKRIMKQCLKRSPSARPSFMQIQIQFEEHFYESKNTPI